MHRVAILAILVGVMIGTIGGMLGGASWFGVGAATATLGVTALWGLAIWKNPRQAMRVDAEVEAKASGYPPPTLDLTTQGELRSPPPAALIMKRRSNNEAAP